MDAPFAVIREILAEPPHVLFETATFQAMLGDVTATSMNHAIEAWARRVWPDLDVPKFDVRPWPIDEVHGAALTGTGNLGTSNQEIATVIISGADFLHEAGSELPWHLSQGETIFAFNLELALADQWQLELRILLGYALQVRR